MIATQVIANAKKPFYFAVRSWRKMGEFLDEVRKGVVPATTQSL